MKTETPMTEKDQLAEARELLEIFQSTLGSERRTCNEGGKLLWDRIESVLKPANSVSHEDLMVDRGTSNWLKKALQEMLLRDPVDATRDAELLSLAMQHHADQVLAEAGHSR